MDNTKEETIKLFRRWIDDNDYPAILETVSHWWDREKKLLEEIKQLRDESAVEDALDYVWKELLINRNGIKYGDWQYPGQWARHIVAEFNDLKKENICDVCLGNGKPISGKPCVCNGTGKASVAAHEYRVLMVKAEQELESALRSERNAIKRMDEIGAQAAQMKKDIDRLESVIDKLEAKKAGTDGRQS